MFALAGAQEYCQCEVPSYWDDIKDLAFKYDSLESINFIRSLRQNYSIGYNAISSTADILEIRKGKICLKSQYDISKISDIDSRWTEEIFKEYLYMLNTFYAESKFDVFFESHQDMYNIATQRMDELMEKVNTKWFDSFYAKPNDLTKLNVFVSITNGPNNYAVPSGILIGAGADANGDPFFEEGMVSLLIHEFGHHFANPIFHNYWSQMENAAKKIYPYVERKMLENAYSGAETMMGEWLTNLFMLMYYRDNDNSRLNTLTETYMARGFVWIASSVDFMENFYTDRKTYPTVNEFMPMLVKHVNEIADNIEFIIQSYEEKRPFIVNISPAPGTDISGITEIVITFSEPMRKQNGFDYFKNENILPMEFVIDSKWSEDGLNFILRVDTTQGVPGCLYGLRFLQWAFVSQQGFQLNVRNEKIYYKIVK